MPPSKRPHVSIQFDLSIFSLMAIKHAAYKFGDRCHFEFETEDDSHITVRLRTKAALDNPDHLVGDFRNAVLDEDLRERVGEETKAVRNLLLAQAFSTTSLLDPEGENADFHDDPQHTGKPDRWTSDKGM